mmetsp:Transcript_77579/g.214376  ORF Transcript_77579/g.214376 Transcript_77579/m.214376 type:complete len:407 (-) Transcript_77579:554-1774(-)
MAAATQASNACRTAGVLSSGLRTEGALGASSGPFALGWQPAGAGAELSSALPVRSTTPSAEALVDALEKCPVSPQLRALSKGPRSRPTGGAPSCKYGHVAPFQQSPCGKSLHGSGRTAGGGGAGAVRPRASAGGETSLGATTRGSTILGSAATATGMGAPDDFDCIGTIGTSWHAVGPMTFGAITFGATMMGLGAATTGFGAKSFGPSVLSFSRAAVTGALAATGSSLARAAIFFASSMILRFSGVRPPRSSDDGAAAVADALAISSGSWEKAHESPLVHEPGLRIWYRHGIIAFTLAGVTAAVPTPPWPTAALTSLPMVVPSRRLPVVPPAGCVPVGMARFAPETPPAAGAVPEATGNLPGPPKGAAAEPVLPLDLSGSEFAVLLAAPVAPALVEPLSLSGALGP